MSTHLHTEIISSRIVNASVSLVYEAFANPEQLKNWWGPHGFSNTIHEFDLKPGGKWILTMHGPEKGNYENASVFKTVEPQKLVAWKRSTKPLFDMEIRFENIGEDKSRITFRMLFETSEECEKMKAFVIPKNEENFDRLESVLVKM
jgi:uncharacterized protein YndB with AHSA1/START domain